MSMDSAHSVESAGLYARMGWRIALVAITNWQVGKYEQRFGCFVLASYADLRNLQST